MKYDARAGRMFRIDRIENNGNFANEAVDITQSFKAIVDFENIESRLELFRFRYLRRTSSWCRLATSFLLVRATSTRTA